MLDEWEFLNITININIGYFFKNHINMALMLGSREIFHYYVAIYKQIYLRL
jgi:hypothetical protein